ncbi:hypothetical protein ACFSWE_04080 [Leucobacter albus]|uniref:Uncharacterized protein n=1 Tax=Leucobacter albus TaxID=272210 RepID=A0ABW3TPK8_9MICO
MPTFPVAEAAAHVAPEKLKEFNQTLEDAKSEGREITDVIIVNGIPIVYASR